MKILVYNVAAEYAGALTILREFYKEVVSSSLDDIQWCFVVSTEEIKKCDNIEVICVPWIKKSWIHRWFFDNFCAKKIIKNYNADLVFSMQNIALSGVECKQIVYLQQSLQFSPIKYSFFKKTERNYWIRKNIIGNMTKHSLKNANAIIVQTKWMSEATKRWLNNTNKDIEIVTPTINLKLNNEEIIEKNKELFIYPAGDGIHKNHQMIIDACVLLKEKNISYKVLFTMKAEDSCYTRDLYNQVKQKGLNIEFVGLLAREEVLKLYREATLVFPSYIETLGLPLLEAKMCGGYILCADLPYGHENLDEYINTKFFDIDNVQELANYMEECCVGKEGMVCVEKVEMHIKNKKQTLVEKVIEIGERK